MTTYIISVLNKIASFFLVRLINILWIESFKIILLTPVTVRISEDQGDISIQTHSLCWLNPNSLFPFSLSLFQSLLITILLSGQHFLHPICDTCLLVSGLIYLTQCCFVTYILLQMTGFHSLVWLCMYYVFVPLFLSPCVGRHIG
jgi:hypothetical protein